MGYQFIHLSGFARVAGAGKAGGHTIFSIAGEAERRPGECPHVPVPQPPTLIFGVMPAEAAVMAQKWAEESKDAVGRGIRKDGLCLAAGVISWPADRPEPEWAAYRDNTLKWLQKQYDDRLKSVVEHRDEAHKHIHYFVVPRPGEKFDVLHPGRAAAAQAKAAGLKKGEQNKVYKEAMRAWQADFHREVSQGHGLTRLGPRRRRLTRAEWKAEQDEAERQAQAVARLARGGELVEIQQQNLAQAQALAEAEAQALAAERLALQKIIKQAQLENQARAKALRGQAAQAFLAGIDSRRRQKEWTRQSKTLQYPPAGLNYEQIERRKDFFQEWRWLENSGEIRRRAVAASRQGREALQKIEERQRAAWEAERVADAHLRETRERLAGLRPLQILEKSKIAAQMQAAEKARAAARAEQKGLAAAEKKLLASCPDSVVERHRHNQEAAREKELAALLARETQEIQEERRREEAEAKARAERRAMRPAPKPKKPGGWSPPSP